MCGKLGIWGWVTGSNSNLSRIHQESLIWKKPRGRRQKPHKKALKQNLKKFKNKKKLQLKKKAFKVLKKYKKKRQIKRNKKSQFDLKTKTHYIEVKIIKHFADDAEPAENSRQLRPCSIRKANRTSQKPLFNSDKKTVNRKVRANDMKLRFGNKYSLAANLENRKMYAKVHARSRKDQLQKTIKGSNDLLDRMARKYQLGCKESRMGSQGPSYFDTVRTYK